MKIITLNCNLPHWKFDRSQRLPFIADAIVSYNPDIICLQEIFFKKNAKFLIKKLKEKKYNYNYHAKNLLISSKLKIKKKSFIEFKEQGKFLSWGILDKIYKKAFQIVEILGKEKILIINCHLLFAKGASLGHYKKTRIKQIIEIFNYLSHIRNKKIILTGDFNFDLKSEPYQVVKKEGFYDPLKNIRGNTFRNKRIDHFFIKGINKQKVKSKIILKNQSPEISDHFGIMIEF